MIKNNKVQMKHQLKEAGQGNKKNYYETEITCANHINEIENNNQTSLNYISSALNSSGMQDTPQSSKVKQNNFSENLKDIHTNNNTHLNWNPNGLYEEAFDKINIETNSKKMNSSFINILAEN